MNHEEKLALLKNMQLVTRWTGQLYEAQAQQLKMLGVLLFGHPVSVEINIPEKTVNYIAQPNKNNGLEALDMARQGVEMILGAGWQTGVTYDGPVSTSGGSNDSSGSQLKSKGKRGSGGVRRKRKASAKSKDEC